MEERGRKEKRGKVGRLEKEGRLGRWKKGKRRKMAYIGRWRAREKKRRVGGRGMEEEGRWKQEGKKERGDGRIWDHLLCFEDGGGRGVMGGVGRGRTGDCGVGGGAVALYLIIFFYEVEMDIEYVGDDLFRLVFVLALMQLWLRKFTFP